MKEVLYDLTYQIMGGDTNYYINTIFYANERINASPSHKYQAFLEALEENTEHKRDQIIIISVLRLD